MAGGGTAVNKNGIVILDKRSSGRAGIPFLFLINGTAYVEGNDLGGGVVIQDAALGLLYTAHLLEGIDIPAQCTHTDTEFFA